MEPHTWFDTEVEQQKEQAVFAFPISRVVIRALMMISIVSLAACSGRLRAVLPGFEGEVEWDFRDPADSDREVISPEAPDPSKQGAPLGGEAEPHGHAEDAAGRVFPVIRLRGALYLTTTPGSEFGIVDATQLVLLREARPNSGLPTVLVDGVWFEHIRVLQTALDGVSMSKARALAAGGADPVHPDGVNEIPIDVNHVGSGVSITLYLPEHRARGALPSPFLFPNLSQDLTLVQGTLVKRIEGSRLEVAEYARAIGALTLEIDWPSGSVVLPEVLLDEFATSESASTLE